MLRIARALPALALLSLTACAASAPTPNVAPSAAPPPVAAAAPAPHAHVAPPNNVIVTGVLRSPRRSFGAVGDLLGASPLWASLRDGLANVEAFAGPELSGALDLDAPIFVMAAGKEDGAVAVGIRPGYEAAVRDRLHLDPATDTGSVGPRLAVALLKTPNGGSRLVGGNQESSVKELGPALADLTADAGVADLHVEVRATDFRDAIRESTREQHKADASRSHKEGSELGEKLLDQAMSDAETFTFDVSLAGQATATVGARFHSSASPFTRWATGHPERVSGAPPAFWHLPESTGFAFFSQGSDPADLEPVAGTLLPELEKTLLESSCPNDATYFIERVKTLFVHSGGYLFAMGGDEAAAATAIASAQKLARYDGPVRARTRLAVQGWFLAEVDDPSAVWTNVLRELAALDAKAPSCKAPTPPDPAKEKSTTDVVAIPARAHLPNGSLHLATHYAPIKKDGPLAHTTHVFAVPVEGHTWLAIGEDEATLTAYLRDVLGAAPEGRTLAVREGLASLRSASVAGGGFVTIEGIQFAGLSASTKEEVSKASGTIEAWRALPSRGTSPILATWGAAPNEARVTFTLSRPAVLDLVSLTAALMQ